MGHLPVVGRAGIGKQVKADTHPFPRPQELGMIPVNHSLRCDPLLLSANGYGRAMLVASGNHQHVISLEAMIPGEYIGRQVTPCKMAQMQCAVSVGPGHGYQYALGHRPKSFTK
jgi:hypothetical protein